MHRLLFVVASLFIATTAAADTSWGELDADHLSAIQRILGGRAPESLVCVPKDADRPDGAWCFATEGRGGLACLPRRAQAALVRQDVRCGRQTVGALAVGGSTSTGTPTSFTLQVEVEVELEMDPQPDLNETTICVAVLGANGEWACVEENTSTDDGGRLRSRTRLR